MLVLALMFTLNLSTAKASDPTPISAEASAVLLSKEFADLSQELSAKAQQHGSKIQLTIINVSHADTQTIVSFTVEARVAADIGSKFEVTGEIVAMLSQTPSGEFAIDGLFFKPAAENPGGASIGN